MIKINDCKAVSFKGLTEAAAQEIKADKLRLILSMPHRTQERDLTLILKLKEEKNPFDR